MNLMAIFGRCREDLDAIFGRWSAAFSFSHRIGCLRHSSKLRSRSSVWATGNAIQHMHSHHNFAGFSSLIISWQARFWPATPIIVVKYRKYKVLARRQRKRHSHDGCCLPAAHAKEIAPPPPLFSFPLQLPPSTTTHHEVHTLPPGTCCRSDC